MTDRIGFIGLGQMGGSMAERLIRDDTELHVYDVSPEARDRFVALGAIAHGSPKEVADAAPIVLACLPKPEISAEVAHGADGVIHGGAIRVYAEMSTIGKTVIEELAEKLAGAGIVMADAPISGGPPAAREGRLAMMLSAPQDAVDQVSPLLARIGRQVYVVGDRVGQAQIMKIVNNMVMAANMVVASEGLVIGAKAGLDAGAMMEVLRAGTGHSAAASDILARAALPGTFDFGAHLSIVEKDMRLAVKEAEALGVPIPTIGRAGQVWTDAVKDGRGSEDFSAIIKSVEIPAGAVVRLAGAPR
ncbi:MAG: NAD(P)-dependent oxidoreductase [Amaricoccus sp.]|uniref:NAD(P)-dependent oxidoreductase n=1 Tax=Amaricoccus sp. TaxID=1872485 RepID=UPI0039E50E71